MDSTPSGPDASPSPYSTPSPEPREVHNSPAYQPTTPQQKRAPKSNITTPSTRARKDDKSWDNARERVHKATDLLTKKRCLIENTDESNMIEHAHMLPKATDHVIVSPPPCEGVDAC